MITIRYTHMTFVLCKENMFQLIRPRCLCRYTNLAHKCRFPQLVTIRIAIIPSVVCCAQLADKTTTTLTFRALFCPRLLTKRGKHTPVSNVPSDTTTNRKLITIIWPQRLNNRYHFIMVRMSGVPRSRFWFIGVCVCVLSVLRSQTRSRLRAQSRRRHVS